MVYTNSIGDQKLIQRKITRNPRYANVESRLDTGASMTRFEKRVSDIQENFKIKQNEIFKRVKLSSFAELILQVAEQDRISQLTDYVNNTGLSDQCPMPSSGVNGSVNESDEEILNESGLIDGLSENNFCPLPSSGPGVLPLRDDDDSSSKSQVPVLQQRTHNTFMDVISGTSERDNQSNRQNGHNSQDTTITGTHSNTRGGPQNGRHHTSLMDVIVGNGERYLEKNPEQYSVRGGSAAPSNIGSFSNRGYKDQFARSEPPPAQNCSNPILNPDAHVNHRGGGERSRHTTSLMDVISGNGERYLETNQHLYSRSTSRKNSGHNTPSTNSSQSANNPILNPEPVQGFQSITNPNRTIPFAPVDQRSYTTLSQVISGTGEKINDSNFEKQDSGDYRVNEQSNKNQDETAYDNCPFLLLDVQKEHLYDRCHIRSAINFDSSALNRTMNPYTPEIMKYMNKDETIIVVYDENEDLAAKVVTNFTERGINNVFLLSGGLKLIARRGLHNLVTGPYPRVCFREDIEKAKHQIPRRNFELPGPQNLVDQYRMKFTDSELAQLRFELDKYNEESSASSSVFSQQRSARTSVGSSIGGRSRVSTGGPPGWK